MGHRADLVAVKRGKISALNGNLTPVFHLQPVTSLAIGLCRFYDRDMYDSPVRKIYGSYAE
jgi:hypothetical protein